MIKNAYIIISILLTIGFGHMANANTYVMEVKQVTGGVGIFKVTYMKFRLRKIHSLRNFFPNPSRVIRIYF